MWPLINYVQAILLFYGEMHLFDYNSFSINAIQLRFHHYTNLA